MTDLAVHTRRNTLLGSMQYEEILGRGAFSIVFKGYFENKLVAIKQVDLNSYLEITGCDQVREEMILRQLDHPNVIRLLHVESDACFRYTSVFFFLMR